MGELDIVISMEWEGRRAVASPGTTRHDLLTEAYGVALPPDHRLSSEDGPLRLRDLADERWCLLREPRFREVLEREMRSAGFEPRLAFEGSNSFGLAASCRARLGVAIVPLGMEVVLPGVVVRPLDEPALTRHIFALVRAGSEQSPAIRTVLDAMREGAADAIRRGVGSPSAPDGAPA